MRVVVCIVHGSFVVDVSLANKADVRGGLTSRVGMVTIVHCGCNSMSLTTLPHLWG